MKKLIILAHPSQYGFARLAARRYETSAKAAGHKVKFLDLYAEERQPFLNFQHPKEPVADNLKESYQKLIIWADEYALFFPMWWGDAPAILKNFIDNNITSGFAYRYAHGLPIGLLKGRAVRIFVTGDGPKTVQQLFGFPIKHIWGTMIFRFCGVSLKSFHFFSRMRVRSPEKKERWLKQVAKLGSK